jgi:DNA-binding beta-propeller fold protein YncE
LLGATPPFQGNTLDQLRATGNFLFSLLASLLSFAGILTLLRDWTAAHLIRLFATGFFAVLAVLTARAASMASYINYDYATEYLVYAHASPAPKQVMQEIDDLSARITGGTALQVAYDNDALYPYWWYLRHYDNKRFYNTEPTRDLRNDPVIIAGKDTFTKVDSITRETHQRFEYLRLWWPNQDYYGLNWERIRTALFDRAMRSAIFDIWLNRDYTAYAALKPDPEQAKQFRIESWSPGDRMVVYIRNDIVQKIWNYGAVIATEPQADPYTGKILELSPDVVIGMPGAGPGQFNTPHDIAVASDGSLYVADSGNHRIQHLSPSGEVLNGWGTYANSAAGDAPGGTFNEPWGVALAPDGSAVYVADTWNHRVQKFTADGQFVSQWGYFGTAEAPEAFWGPRDITVDAQGRVYVTDTGNKRIVVFDGDGQFLAQFGSAGFDPGQFDEPMGVGVDADNRLFVADTWNQRMQVFENQDLNFVPVLQWDVNAWFGQSLQNYPFVAVNPQGQVFVTDPEGYRVLVYSPTGEFLYGWGGYSSASDGFGLASGIAFDPQGGVWISDAGNNTLLHFDLSQVTIPAAPGQPQEQP